MATVELRFLWPASNGSAVFRLTQEEALRAAVLMRGLGLGLTFKSGEAMVTTRTASYSAAEMLVLKARRKV